VRSLLSNFAAIARDPRTREVLLWCAPALLLGLVLRVVLVAQMPYAYYHDDTPDFLITADRLLYGEPLSSDDDKRSRNSEPKESGDSDEPAAPEQSAEATAAEEPAFTAKTREQPEEVPAAAISKRRPEFKLHAKKTFLTPVIFTIPILLGIPAMIAIPIFQHLLGLGMVVLLALLVRLWFVQWKWFILPITILAAANPFFIWYEHTLMAETLFLFCTVLLALAGTLYARKQSLARFAFLCVTLFLEAGARPEGKLLFGFTLLLLLLLHFRELRPMWPRFAIFSGSRSRLIS
jgi:hypothetical protein